MGAKANTSTKVSLMIKIKSLLYRLVSKLTVALLIISVFIYAMPVYAEIVPVASTANIPYSQTLNRDFQSDEQLLISQNSKRACFFFVFCINRSKTITRPSQTRNAVRRGQCSKFDSSLRALVPVLQQDPNQGAVELPDNLQNSIGFTASDDPKFWFYIPSFQKKVKGKESTSQVSFAEFTLQDESGHLLEQPIPIRLSDESGIVSFQLPSREEWLRAGQSASMFFSEHGWLKPNQPYHWFFSILCAPREPSKNPSVDGWIQWQASTATELHHSLSSANSAKQIEIYANNDIWYEAVTQVIMSRCKNSQDLKLKEYWDQLLEEVGLKQDKQILCKPEQQLQVAYDLLARR